MSTYKALLIGNWDYTDPKNELPKIKGPEQNVQALGAALRHSQYGLFDDVETRYNLDLSGIADSLWEFIDGGRPGEHLLIYYTGHGDRLGGGELGLCGVVAKGNREIDSFHTSQLKTWLATGRARSTVVIFDCCYSGAYLGGAPGGVTDAAIENALGEGIGFLASGGLEPVPAARDDEPTPFTKALVDIMLDPRVREFGTLSIADVFAALDGYEPKLTPKPVHSPGPRGHLALAKRKDLEASDGQLHSWTQRPVETIDIVFHEREVEVVVDGVTTRSDIVGLDPTRQMSLRRLPQLIDAVVRSPGARDDARDTIVRKAWECVGASLFDALPRTVREHVRAADDGSGKEVLRLRLGCVDDDVARQYQLFPWEYLLPFERDLDEPSLPLGLRDHMIVERVCGTPPTAVTRDASRLAAAGAAPGAAGRSLTPPMSRSVKVGHVPTPSPATKSAAPSSSLVGIVNAFGGEHQNLGRRLGGEIKRMSRASLVFELGNNSDRADWPTFVQSLALQDPHHLVLALPIQRIGNAVSLGFFDDGPVPDWRPINSVAKALDKLSRRHTLSLLTVAAAPGHDAYRGVAFAAQRLAYQLRTTVSYVCHRPEYAAANIGEHPEPRTFHGLLISALAGGLDLEQAVCYSTTNSVVHVTANLLNAYGVPGYYRWTADADVTATGARAEVIS